MKEHKKQPGTWPAALECAARRLCWAILVLGQAATSAAQTNPVATVPISFRGAQIMLPARVNDSEPLSFMLDTGFTMTMIRPQLADTLQLRRVGEITVVGIAGEDRAPTFEGAVFDIGGARYAPRRIGAMQTTQRRRDGIIGAGLFRQYVVAVDSQARTLSLYTPGTFTYTGAGEVVPLKFRRSTPIIAASVIVSNRAPIEADFEIDTGCDSAVCVGQEFTFAHGLLETTQTQSGAKYGVGGGAKTRSGHLPRLQIGTIRIDRPETDFFIEGSPVDRGLAGHIGMEALRQFKVIFDYSRKQMILERPASAP